MALINARPSAKPSIWKRPELSLKVQEPVWPLICPGRIDTTAPRTCSPVRELTTAPVTESVLSAGLELALESETWAGSCACAYCRVPDAVSCSPIKQSKKSRAQIDALLAIRRFTSCMRGPRDCDGDRLQHTLLNTRGPIDKPIC